MQNAPSATLTLLEDDDSPAASLLRARALRMTGQSDYVFVVNDHREAGSYVGQHGMVMENGLPSEGEVSLLRGSGHVYDLVNGREVPAKARLAEHDRTGKGVEAAAAWH